MKQQGYLAFSCIEFGISWWLLLQACRIKKSVLKQKKAVFYMKLCSSWGVQGVISVL